MSKTTTKYKATLKTFGNKKFTSEGKSLVEAIENLKPDFVAGISVLTIEKGKKKQDKVFPLPLAKKTFMTLGLTKEINIKRAAELFNV